jgi:4-hydroxybenzoate polyprenyltransferase/phosphoserine phosphatase
MKQKPMVIDIDGTLFAMDTAWENLRLIFFKRPAKIPALLASAARGRAKLKSWLHQEAGLELEKLPFRDEVLAVVQHGKKRRRPIHIVSGAPQGVVDHVVRRLGLACKRDQWGSTSGTNLTRAKSELLNQKFGFQGYDYYGDCEADLPVFSRADSGGIVGARPHMVRMALRANPRLKVIHPQPPFGVSAWKSLRTHQWIKNLLLLVPLFAAHEWNQPGQWLIGFKAMAAFSFLSSSVYLLNDLHDLESDRCHPQKKRRPIASGELKIYEAFWLVVMLLGIAFGIAWTLGQGFFAGALVYLSMAGIYNVWAKSKSGLDLVILALFYTLRILAGGAALSIPCSPWLLGYATFIFISLASIKRVSELLRLKKEKKVLVAGRGYVIGDLEAMTGIGISSGVVSVLVAALYVSSPDVAILYSKPRMLWLVCPVLFYWVTRVWLKTLRGGMPEDPVLFAVKDRASWVLLFLLMVVVQIASR